MKKTLFTMLLLASLTSSGFAYAETVYTWYNEDSASAKSEPPDVVYGAYSDDAEVREGDIQIFRDSDSGHYVEEIYRAVGGYSREGSATKNNAEITDGTVGNLSGGVSEGGAATDNFASMRGGSAGDLLGGFSAVGVATKNTAFISGGSVENLYGGRSEEGIATINTAIIAGGSANYVYGGYSGCGNSTDNTASMEAGKVGHLYGGYSIAGRASSNIATLTGGYVGNLFGGYSKYGAEANDNTVLVSDGEVGNTLIGGESYGENANNNKVVVSGGEVSEVYGGVTRLDETEARGNSVFITGGHVGTVKGAKSDEGACVDNHVHLIGVGASITVNDVKYNGAKMHLGYVQGGESRGSSTGNSVDIHGSGIQAVSLTHMQILNFHLVDGLATAEAPMVALSGDNFNMENLTLGIKADDVTDWGLLAGRTVTLAETQLAITGFGSTPYKVVDVTKTGQSASKGILTLGNEGKDLLLKVLRPGTEVLASGDSRQAGSATITALKENEPGLLDNLTLDTDTILGAGRAASLADGLKIQSDADLMIMNMTITANNEIHVGDNTITLKDVTIKISDDVCQPVNGIYTIDLKSLINCNLEMQNVLLDASDLILPEGFDPATTSVVFDFGDDVTIRQATGLDMRLGNYWSPSLNLGQQGKVIFTKLVDTPEPTTGTLGLLALAALAARRRRK